MSKKNHPRIGYEVTLSPSVQNKLLLGALGTVGVMESYARPHILRMSAHQFSKFIIAAQKDGVSLAQLKAVEIDYNALPIVTVVRGSGSYHQEGNEPVAGEAVSSASTPLPEIDASLLNQVGEAVGEMAAEFKHDDKLDALGFVPDGLKRLLADIGIDPAKVQVIDMSSATSDQVDHMVGMSLEGFSKEADKLTDRIRRNMDIVANTFYETRIPMRGVDVLDHVRGHGGAPCGLVRQKEAFRDAPYPLVWEQANSLLERLMMESGQ
ncbi:hypothetical protein CNR35_00056 [Pseudomonas phage inbricus]|uniref:Uncharacterized protein n=1 Tax=Pseudomonas phage inbricus TaxID=2048976 RepID=A0A2H4P7I8_9CAUD|nr:hypothetical protein KMC58_gp56 [Pseudomonas phage inbricus]ATW58152.1 hypothetical protein CNR35_00056 [Pseudomonas phage inbricus]